jgi:hypothetical protein
MKVKGFIIQDSQGGEFVVVCEQECIGLGSMFSLKDWKP